MTHKKGKSYGRIMDKRRLMGPYSLFDPADEITMDVQEIYIFWWNARDI